MSYVPYNFTSYEEIPENTVDYILTVSDADHITDCTLYEINDFLNNLEEINQWVNRGDYKYMPR